MSRPPYPPEFRRQMVEELAKEFEPTAQSIRNWVVLYDQALASGWPIATGVIEGTCRCQRLRLVEIPELPALIGFFGAGYESGVRGIYGGDYRSHGK
jgi:hypothetical protein